MSGAEDKCPVCGGPIVTGRHAVIYSHDGPRHERASDCVRFVRDALAEAENELADLRAGHRFALKYGHEIEAQRERAERAEAELLAWKNDMVASLARSGGADAALAEFARQVRQALGDLWDSTPTGPSAADAIAKLRAELEETREEARLVDMERVGKLIDAARREVEAEAAEKAALVAREYEWKVQKCEDSGDTEPSDESYIELLRTCASVARRIEAAIHASSEATCRTCERPVATVARAHPKSCECPACDGSECFGADTAGCARRALILNALKDEVR